MMSEYLSESLFIRNSYKVEIGVLSNIREWELVVKQNYLSSAGELLSTVLSLCIFVH